MSKRKKLVIGASGFVGSNVTRNLVADCAAAGVYDFQLVAPPLRVVGAVGSPINPVAIK